MHWKASAQDVMQHCFCRSWQQGFVNKMEGVVRMLVNCHHVKIVDLGNKQL
jgi:hypothetical protein